MNPFVMLWSRKRILRRGRLTGCMILIALVTAPVVAALIFSQSMIGAMSQKFISVSDGHIQISDASYRNLPEQMVLYSDDTVHGYALMYSANETASVKVKGVNEDYFNSYRLKQLTLVRLDEDNRSNLNGIIISASTAEKLGTGMGDKVALMIVPDTDSGVLRPVMLQITGIYSTGYGKIDNSLAFADLAYASGLYSDSSSAVTEIVVRSEYQNRLGEVKQSIETDGYVTDWQQLNSSVYENYLVSMQAITVVMMIILIVAAFYTASVANQFIADDSAEIAVAKLMGTSDRKVRRSAFICVFSVTVSGMIIGLVLGILIGTNLSPVLTGLAAKGILTLDFYLIDFDASVPWNYILPVMLSMAVVSSLSITFSLRHTRKITPLRLFTGL